MTHLSCLVQGLHYNYFELEKNVDPERETDLRFQSAFTVHPVLDPLQMYRLHKYFAQVELERTYQEIQQLQVRPGLDRRIWAPPVMPLHSNIWVFHLNLLWDRISWIHVAAVSVVPVGKQLCIWIGPGAAVVVQGDEAGRVLRSTSKG